MAKNPASTWMLLDSALTHLMAHVEKKGDFSLSIIDLLHVSNFKGGNASITEPEPYLSTKLQTYSKQLQNIDNIYNARKLAELSTDELRDVKKMGAEFLLLTRESVTRIRGFGASYASALLFAHFPNLFPVLDRRVLNGAGISVQLNSQGQVKMIGAHYPALIQAFHCELQRNPRTSLRDLDKRWFMAVLPVGQTQRQGHARSKLRTPA